MDNAARISALTADSPPEEVSAVLSAAASAAETASESEDASLTTALADALLALPASVSTTGAGQHLCRLTAELAKREENRARLSVPSLLGRLVEVLAAAAEPKEDVDDLVQPCRALGNLCYEGEPARAGLVEPPGPEALTAAVLKATTAGKEGARAREVASGLVLNFINDYPAGVDWAVDSESLNRLIASCCDDVTQSSLLRHALVAAAVVVDSPRREALLGSRLAALLAVCLLPQREPSVLEEALENAAAWCRHDEARLALAHGGVADSLVCLLPAVNCPAEARALLVELLSGDQAMAAVYRRGEGAVYKEVRRWLAEGGAAETLTACACDALSNFATNDDHATGMVRSGVHLDLVPPLKSDSARLQMAALSLLRNLCLPSANKVALLEAGMLDHLLSLSVVEQPALFKDLRVDEVAALAAGYCSSLEK
ncbi:Rap1 GTPase-GDP dissociation stimulator 1 [Amphibalanus amphitrite]|uniref:Rap1 GTPase-GDP dissociation stimulator 1 n=1 Tax=Amphibalanus amphitrite TaxID=1232801 RepID=A0A6A4VBM1_AMPAM|nr:Rap1 GTPase-GDP dissociation stimulator 1 [Amphibalanus amphitrite]